MKTRHATRESFERLDKLAHDVNDIKPISPAMRREWDAARRTGKKLRPGRPRKDPTLKSRIVPISLDPMLLAEIDRFAKSAGLTRSALIAQALRLRMGRKARATITNAANK